MRRNRHNLYECWRKSATECRSASDNDNEAARMMRKAGGWLTEKQLHRLEILVAKGSHRVAADGKAESKSGGSSNRKLRRNSGISQFNEQKQETICLSLQSTHSLESLRPFAFLSLFVYIKSYFHCSVNLTKRKTDERPKFSSQKVHGPLSINVRLVLFIFICFCILFAPRLSDSSMCHHRRSRRRTS
jgi:hypothetical protein